MKRPLSVLSIDESWERVINNVCSSSKPLRIGICGPKGTGKSTLGKILSNRLVTRPKLPAQPEGAIASVCWLDIDPGQPEFSPPGQVSLVQLRSTNFGPPYTHPFTDSRTSYRTIRAHSVGSVTPTDDPDHYLACVMDLLDQFQKTIKVFPNCPLIVNFSGWVLGHALEVTGKVIQKMLPTDIVYTSTAGLEDVVQVLAEAAKPGVFHRIVSHSPPAEAWHAADLRAMQFMSYFHQDEPSNGQLRWNAASISSFRPWKLKYAGDDRTVIAVQVLRGIGPEFLCTILEGCFVSIVLLEDATAAEAMDRERSPEGIPCWLGGSLGYTTGLDPRKSRIIGLGLVSNINAEANTISLWTPLSEATRQEVLTSCETNDPRIVLVRGSLDTPGWAYLEDVYLQEKGRAKVVEKNENQDSNLDLELDQEGQSFYDPSEVQSPERPWLHRLQPGETMEKRWRVRRNLKR